jgi:SAM-dependent methyltransferase
VIASQELLPRAGQKVLHVAPEWIIERKLRALRGVDYLSVDLVPGRAMVAMDITDTGSPGDVYDRIICSHVLDLIPSDQQAMREMYRILRPGGVLLVQVAMGRNAATLQDPAIASPEARREFYGQNDKLRLYGPDLADRLAAAGFEVTVHDPRFALTARKYAAFALDDSTRCWSTNSIVHVCRKP